MLAYKTILIKLEENKDTINKYQQRWVYANEYRFVSRLSAFICVHLRLIISSPQRAQRTQSGAVTLRYEKKLPQRQRTRMTRIARIFTDTKSVCIRVIRAIRVPSYIKPASNNGFFIPTCEIPFLAGFANFASSAVNFLGYACPHTPITEA